MKTSLFIAASALVLGACAQPDAVPAVAPAAYSIPLPVRAGAPLTEAEHRAYVFAQQDAKQILRVPGLSPHERASRIDALVATHGGTAYASMLEQVARNRLVGEVLLRASDSPERTADLRRNAERLVALDHPDADLMARVLAELPEWDGRAAAASATVAAAEAREARLAEVCPDGACAGRREMEARPEVAAVVNSGERAQDVAVARLSEFDH